MSRITVFLFVGAAVLGGCTTAAQRKAAEKAAVQKQAGQEIERICSLPQAEREAELKRVKDKSGVVIMCGKD